MSGSKNTSAAVTINAPTEMDASQDRRTVRYLHFAPWLAAAPVCLSPPVTGSILALGALGTGVAYVWNTGIVAAWGAAIASTVTYLIPVVGVILGVIVLSEPLAWNEPAGAVIVIVGILTAQNRLAAVTRYVPRGLRILSKRAVAGDGAGDLPGADQ